MNISDDDYAKAIKTVFLYRQERGMDFYLPINIEPSGDIPIEELKRYLSIQKSIT